MRGTTKWRGTKRLTKVPVRRVALCTSVRDDSAVTPARLSTGDYPEHDRNRLAVAVTRARDAAGLSQQQLADRAAVSKRSIAYLENAEPRVGRKVLEAVARNLPGWDPDTPKVILEGGDPPPVSEHPSSAAPGPVASGIYSARDVELALLLHGKGFSAEEIFQVIDSLPGQGADQLSVEPPTGTDR
jgi:DNA-binding XRE family transcriptional regulator